MKKENNMNSMYVKNTTFGSLGPKPRLGFESEQQRSI